ncbi:MAG TPA: IS66 family transposase [Gaiellaceae bacterium]|nr:IS66 family transposase [Gaiellaceae bacterium]
MERVEAEAILDGDRETAIGLLLRLDELVVANQRLVEANERLEGRVAELERRLNRSSRNSSLPPSQDPPSAPSRPRGKGSGGKRGGQHGHEGRYRRLFPPDRVDEIVEHWPERCGACAREFAEADRVDPTEPSRRQVVELPPIAVRVTEHRLHRVCCPECAAVTAAETAPGSRWAFGPRLQAAVVTLAVRNRVSRRDTTELARELFGVELSTGSVDAIVQRAGEALAAPHTRLEQEIKRSPVVNIDETGWKTRGERRMLWGALTRRTAVFRIAAGRHAAEAQTMLGERYDGIVCSDRWAGYDYLDPTRRQLCWAHLLRDFTAHSEGLSEQREFGNAGLVVAHNLFDAWEQFQHDDDQAALQTTIAPLQTKLRTELERASRKSPRTKYHRQFARNLLKRWPALWTFSHTDGVEPTNNHAERCLRGAVIYRKLSLGTQSERGERSLERLLSASITCRLRKQSLLTYLTEVITAHARGDPIPALN